MGITFPPVAERLSDTVLSAKGFDEVVDDCGSVEKRAIAVPTVTVWFGVTNCSDSRPDPAASRTTNDWSVSNSISASPDAKDSPVCFSHRTTVAVETAGEDWGRTKSAMLVRGPREESQLPSSRVGTVGVRNRVISCLAPRYRNKQIRSMQYRQIFEQDVAQYVD